MKQKKCKHRKVIFDTYKHRQHFVCLDCDKYWPPPSTPEPQESKGNPENLYPSNKMTKEPITTQKETPEGWEMKLGDYMVELTDEYFPKDNYDHPERKSTTHRSEAIASFSLFFIKFKEVFNRAKEEGRREVELKIKDYVLRERKNWNPMCRDVFDEIQQIFLEEPKDK